MTYDFKCTRCSSVFELRRKMGDSSPATCPVCGGDAERIFSTPAIVMHWYDSDSVHESKRFRGAVQGKALRSS